MSPNMKDGTKTGKEPVGVSRTRWNQTAGTVISQRHILELPLLMARTGNASGEQQRYKLGPSSALLAASFLSLPQRQPAAFSWRRMAAALRPLPSPLPSLPRAGLRAAGLCGPHPAHGPGSGRRGRAGPGRAVPSPGAAGPSGQREGRGPAGSPSRRHGSRPNAAAGETARSPPGSAGNSPRSSMVPVPPPALLSASQLSRPAPRACPSPARSRRRRACPRLPSAGGSGGNGAARHSTACGSGSSRSDLVLGAAEGDEAFPELAVLRAEPAPGLKPAVTRRLVFCASRDKELRSYRPAAQTGSGSESWK